MRLADGAGVEVFARPRCCILKREMYATTVKPLYKVPKVQTLVAVRLRNDLPRGRV